jgi:hypothetical protein
MLLEWQQTRKREKTMANQISQGLDSLQQCQESDHRHCKHFDDARNYYGPLHVINWMKIKKERLALGWTVDAYVKACAERGIGSAQEHEEFREKLYGIQ